jgi:hypothetical protein
VNDPTLVREMTLDDCDRVSRIRIRGRRHTYRGLMPQPYLDSLSIAEEPFEVAGVAVPEVRHARELSG